MPDRSAFKYTFHDIARVIERFPEVVGLDRFAIYVFDCCPGGEFPVGAKFESAMPLQRPASKVYDVGVDDIRLLQRGRSDMISAAFPYQKQRRPKPMGAHDDQ